MSLLLRSSDSAEPDGDMVRVDVVAAAEPDASACVDVFVDVATLPAAAVTAGVISSVKAVVDVLQSAPMLPMLVLLTYSKLCVESDNCVLDEHKAASNSKCCKVCIKWEKVKM